MKINLKYLFLTAIASAGFAVAANAAEKVVTPPAAHQSEHGKLIAGQLNVGNQIKAKDTENFLDNLFPEEQEPEGDIFTEGWNSQSVNPFNAASVPNSKVLDVSKFHMPTKRSYVTSPYGWRARFGRMHKGVDLKVQVGDTIYATFDGRVRLTRNEGYKKGYGLYVVLRHNNQMETVYGHLSKFLVKPDQYVKAGDPIALGGNTGRSTGPHLHFETRYMGYAINPQAIFDFANHTTHTDTYTFTKTTYMNARNYKPDKAAYASMQNGKAPNQTGMNNAASKGVTVVNESTAATNKSAGKSQYYTVRRGDTVSRIAGRNNSSVSTICRLNGISANSKLKPGTTLRLR